MPSSKKPQNPPNAALDDALYVPHLDKIEMPESFDLGRGPGYGFMVESICGATDDSQPVEQYDGTLGVTAGFVSDHQSKVAQVQWNNNLGSVYSVPGDVRGVRWGSGTMISPDLFLTCGHLFDSNPTGWTVPRQNGTATPITPQEIATNMHLNFNYQVDAAGVQRAEQSFAITELLEYRLGGIDMAICRIAGNPGNIYGWSEVSTVNASVGDMLAIIGHPAGRPKRIEAGPCTALTASPARIRYNDIDTLGGNSGSGILQASTGRIVGVHTNGGCNADGTGSNFGMPIAAVRAVSPILQGLAASSATGSARDLTGTGLALDTSRAADIITTIRALDNPATLASFDRPITARASDILGTALSRDIGTSLAGDRFPIDPNNTWVEKIFDPGAIAVDPRVIGGLAGGFAGGLAGGGVQPFVLAGKHQPIEGAEAPIGDPTEQVLGELQGLLGVLEAVAQSIAALHDVIAGEG